VGVAAVAGLAAVNYVGVSRTARLARVIVVVVLAVLAVVVVSGVLGGSGSPPWPDVGGSGWYGVLQSAGLLFFAFAGYARIATMGEEIKDPTRTIPRAILTALGVTLAVYAAVAVTVLGVLGPEQLAASTAPLVHTVQVAGWSWAAPVVRVGAAAASLGALLALIAGVGRTALAMARNDDLPAWLAAVHPRYRVPHHAEVALGALVIALVLAVDLRGAIGFSSFGVLLYYVVANAAAYTQTPAHRRYPRWLQVAGVVGCLLLVITLPPASITAGVAVLAIGVAYRLARRRSSGAARAAR
jgi:APA family basic amino acid/polyamine antiporter